MSDTWSAKLNKINQTKEDIKEAIINKGVSVSDSDTFRSYAEKIDDIPGPIIDSIFTAVNEPEKLSPTNNDWEKKYIKRIDLSTVEIKATSYERMFYNFKNLSNVIFPSDLDTSNVTSMKQMFYGTNIETVNVSNWNTSNVTDMSFMFNGCPIHSLDMSSWDTSKVTDMGSMFSIIHSSDITLGDNWGSNSSLEGFGLPASLDDEDSYRIFSKLATRINSPNLSVTENTINNMSESTIAMITDKGWTINGRVYP